MLRKTISAKFKREIEISHVKDEKVEYNEQTTDKISSINQSWIFQAAIEKLGIDLSNYRFNSTEELQMIEEIIEEWIYVPTTIGCLNLSSKSLKILPAIDCKQFKLHTLDISDNQFESDIDSHESGICRSLLNLNDCYASIKRLDLSGCNLISLPMTTLNNLHCLVDLFVGFNRLRSLEGLPSQLEWLDVKANPIDRLPNDLNRLTALILIDLSMCSGAFGSNPSGSSSSNALANIERLSETKKLRCIDLSSNIGLNRIPLVVCRMSLSSLRMDAVGLNRIPEEITLMTNLRSLSLAHNQLEEIPRLIGCLTTLEKLDLSYNHLNCLPAELGRLGRLQTLKLVGNNQLGFDLQSTTQPTKLLLSFRVSLRKSLEGICFLLTEASHPLNWKCMFDF